jgi:hypothetical protein
MRLSGKVLCRLYYCVSKNFLSTSRYGKNHMDIKYYLDHSIFYKRNLENYEFDILYQMWKRTS